jgi:hypothetical protein
MGGYSIDCQTWQDYFPSGPKAILLTITTPLLLIYLLTLWISSPQPRNPNGLKRASTVPYILPYFGHSFVFGFRGRDFLHENALVFISLKGTRSCSPGQCSIKFGRSTLHRIVLPGLNQFMTTSPEHVRRVFRSERMLMTEPHTRAMERSFGMSPKAVEFVCLFLRPTTSSPSRSQNLTLYDVSLFTSN